MLQLDNTCCIFHEYFPSLHKKNLLLHTQNHDTHISVSVLRIHRLAVKNWFELSLLSFTNNCIQQASLFIWLTLNNT